jgi:hypothetical protein
MSEKKTIDHGYQPEPLKKGYQPVPEGYQPDTGAGYKPVNQGDKPAPKPAPPKKP